MDAISKEFETWNLTFHLVLAILINSMLRKYFSVLLVQNVNVICKFFNAMKDNKTATQLNL